MLSLNALKESVILIQLSILSGSRKMPRFKIQDYSDMLTRMSDGYSAPRQSGAVSESCKINV